MQLLQVKDTENAVAVLDTVHVGTCYPELLKKVFIPNGSIAFKMVFRDV